MEAVIGLGAEPSTATRPYAGNIVEIAPAKVVGKNV